MVAELVVTKGRPKWDNKAGIVVVFQAAQQLSGGPPVFEKAGNAAGGEAGWKNAGVRQIAQGEKIVTKINIQVMAGRKKPGASEQIHTKNQEVRIRMAEAEGSTLFAEEEIPR
jgi:putative aminopeptidase FrvX